MRAARTGPAPTPAKRGRWGTGDDDDEDEEDGEDDEADEDDEDDNDDGYRRRGRKRGGRGGRASSGQGAASPAHVGQGGPRPEPVEEGLGDAEVQPVVPRPVIEQVLVLRRVVVLDIVGKV
jgi:ribonuclease E